MARWQNSHCSSHTFTSYRSLSSISSPRDASAISSRAGINPLGGPTSQPVTLSNDIRESFLSFFEKNGHTRMASSSLIPQNDPSLLFTNAGMVPHKDAFLGLSQYESGDRVTSCQKCVRAGGKHNDLDNVGHTARHHTFFEMLGNFSFGGYFKEEAILYAWKYITEELCLPRDKLRVSVFTTDDESVALWEKITGLSESNGGIVRFGEEDNFWSMGAVGPCGPCTEIFFDQGKEVDGDRWLEIWNLVFMQHERLEDGTLIDLPKPSVDTGMGLERVAAVLQGVSSNFEIDSFDHIIRHISKVIDSKPRTQNSLLQGNPEDMEVAKKVIADHIRAVSMLVCDGVIPSSVGRGYVLRRIIRRAITYAARLGIQGQSPFYSSP